MSDQTSRALDIYLTGLRNQHAVENQAIELLQRQVERLENYPEMERRMRLHIEESRQQAQRLEELLGQHDSSRSGFKDTMASLMGNMAAIAHTAAQDEVMKNTFANYAFEHFEIAAYNSLIALAEHVGQGAAMSALQQSLREELAMAKWIDENLAATTLRYAQLASAGAKAGV